MAHELPALPFAQDALEPHISAETLSIHHGKHHNAYVTKLNGMIEGTEFAESSLEDIVKGATGGTFNNAAQVWNHTFYWNCMAPGKGGAATGKVAEEITKKWGSFDQFKEAFSNAAATNFGSGWTWLVTDGTHLEIKNTSNAGCPLRDGLKPVLCVDVWEHAYYVDYRNARPKYLEAWWNLVNWDFVNEQV